MIFKNVNFSHLFLFMTRNLGIPQQNALKNNAWFSKKLLDSFLNCCIFCSILTLWFCPMTIIVWKIKHFNICCINCKDNIFRLNNEQINSCIKYVFWHLNVWSAKNFSPVYHEQTRHLWTNKTFMNKQDIYEQTCSTVVHLVQQF